MSLDAKIKASMMGCTKRISLCDCGASWTGSSNCERCDGHMWEGVFPDVDPVIEEEVECHI